MGDVIAKVVSGGQTGVDVAALRAAKSLGIPTGGTMPHGFRTDAGPKSDWAAEFGLTEHASAAYPPRTYENVRDSDITVRIAVDLESAGERCTANACERYGKPPVDIQIRHAGWHTYVVDEADIRRAADAIRATSARLGRSIVVNFAGNSERTAPGIERFAESVVRAVLEAATASRGFTEGPDTPDPHPPDMMQRPRLTPEKIEAALKRGDEGAKDLRESLRDVFVLDAESAERRLR